MADKKIEDQGTENPETVKKESSYTKEQILKSKKYHDRRDLLSVLLEDDKQYTLKQADSLLKAFYRKKVN